MATQSYGEKAVGITFNPSGDEQVARIKELYAQIIDLCNELRTVEPEGAGPISMPRVANSERNRLFAIAITSAQGAQMWAVKAITWREE